jgi:hypothetical protein
MTEKRHLKQLVRERMARTGESYSTARRHLLAGARGMSTTSLPVGLVRGYDAFGAGQHRESTLLAHLLRQAGYVAPHTGEPYTEEMLCGLAGGIGFMYAVFEYADLPPMVTIVAQHHPDPWLTAGLDRLGIGYTEEHSGKPDRALLALRNALQNDRPIYCSVDRTRLPWRAGELGISSDPFGVVVCGRSTDELFVDDRGEAPRRISEVEFAAAWSGHAKGRHHRLVVTQGSSTGPIAGAVRAAVDTTVKHLTGPVLGNSFDVNFGFSGMRKLAAQLRDAKWKSGWGTRFTDPGVFANVLRRIHDCIELQYTAHSATRSIYADFLDEAAGVLEARPFEEAAGLFRLSADTWSQFSGRAAEAADSLGPIDELAERRMALIITRGAGARDEIAAVSDEIDRLAMALDVPPLAERRALFVELGDLVDQARAHEEEAVRLLTSA